MVLLDTNVLIYYLDETAEKNAETVRLLQRLVDEDEQLATSHHVIEEVLFVLSKTQPGANLHLAVRRISEIPGIILVEPASHLTFAERYAKLADELNTGVNDALLLQLMLDAGITHLFSYDKQFTERASGLGIEQVSR